MTRRETDNLRRRRRPCIRGCGIMTMREDVCSNCRRAELHWRETKKKRPHSGTPKRQGKCCSVCEGLSWRRPERGKCKCGKSFAPETPPKISDGMSRSACIFDGQSTRA